jgi:hypothetical protein
MLERKQEINFTRQFIYYDVNGNEINKCPATSKENINSAIPYAFEDDRISHVRLIDLSTQDIVGTYIKSKKAGLLCV